MEEIAPRQPTATVTRVVCVSASKFDGPVMHELLAIRNELCAPGRHARARVALLYTSGWFMLWAEGSDAAVDKVLKQAAADKRIATPQLLHRSSGPMTLPERIMVSTTQSPLRPTQCAQLIAALAKRSADLQPVEIFRHLGGPCLIAPPEDITAQPVRRIALLSAEANSPIDQLRKLGERFRTPVVHRRFGGARRHMADVGSSYLDIPIAEGIGRIHLLSRRLIGNTLLQRALSNAEGIALLVGANAPFAISVASSLGDSLQCCSPQPAVHVIGATQATVDACSTLLQERGISRVKPLTLAAQAQEIQHFLPLLGWRHRGNSVSAAPGPSPAVGEVSRGWASPCPA